MNFFCQFFSHSNKCVSYVIHPSSGYKHNFDKYTTSQVETLGTPFDFHSIMQLHRQSWSSSGLNTIEARRGSAVKIGGATELSPIDKQMLNDLYQCNKPGSSVGPGVLVISYFSPWPQLLVLWKSYLVYDAPALYHSLCPKHDAIHTFEDVAHCRVFDECARNVVRLHLSFHVNFVGPLKMTCRIYQKWTQTRHEGTDNSLPALPCP